MNHSGLEKIAAERKCIAHAVEMERWDEVAVSLTNLLWSVAESRPDFEELPSWIAEVCASGMLSENTDRVEAGIEQVHTILQAVVNRYGNDEDRAGFAQMHSLCGEIGTGELAVLAGDLAQQALTLRKGIRRLSLAISNDQLLIGRHTRISFNRTLRIPEDGREYPLPAGFGRLPILRVEDYAKRVPEQWLEQGGFIIPLYQREALFLEFAGVPWRPTIGKVSVGRVNAISGKEHDLKIRPHRQDYVVIPDQRWLDGINSGSGSVSQFVAMPLGKGYTIEAQITDEEKYGGFQFAVFDPRAGRFLEQDPKEKDAAIAARKQRALRVAQQELINGLPSITTRVIGAVQEQHYQNASKSLGISEKEILQIIEGARLHLEGVLGANGFEGVIPVEHLQVKSDTKRVMFSPIEGRHAAKPAIEMGIAGGGRIKQQIMEDTYGAESWDEAAFRDIVIHIVNSEVYQQITGRDAPPSPITIEQYKRYKIPWYSDYKEKAPSLSPSAAFKRLFSIGQIDKNRGVAKDDAPPKREIQPEEILRIYTPSLDDRWQALLDRAVESSKSGRHRIAAREASLALDISDQHPLPFFIRALSNHHLEHHSDAEADASACLSLQPDHIGALSIRAYSSLALGETLLAKNDAETILASLPNDHDGLYVRAEANLRLGRYDEALAAADKLLSISPGNQDVLRIQAECFKLLTNSSTPKNFRKRKLGAAVPKDPFNHGDYKLPSLELLDPPDFGNHHASDPDEMLALQATVIETLAQFGVAVAPGDISRGPTITRYEVYPAKGVRVEEIVSLEHDIARATRAEWINILAPIPGKDTVGIEIANSKKHNVTFREMLESDDWLTNKAEIPLVLGKDVCGKAIFGDLSRMPHLLVAGATGSGKSVCINSIIASILYRFGPEHLRLVMIDPKVVELQIYNSLPHLVIPVVTDPKKALLAFRWVIDEMEKRYKIFVEAGVRNIVGFNSRSKPNPQWESDDDQAMPNSLRDNGIEIPEGAMSYIVVIVNELADLMQIAPEDFESGIVRITQMAHAAGIHMIIATHAPRSDVLTEVIQANIPCRIAFHVASALDSREVLGENGAERLGGPGDMLYRQPGTSSIVRAQGALVTDDEILRLVDFATKQGTSHCNNDVREHLSENDDQKGELSEEDEELLQKCLEIMRQEKKASTSLFQRRLRLGYTSAARFIDILEARGYIAPGEGATPRQILKL